MGVERRVIKSGTGPKPQIGQKVTVHATGCFAETGKKFWSTKDPGNEAFSFNVGVGHVIRGWDEGLLQMQLQETACLELSADYAYGSQGFPAWGIPPNTPLSFEIELISIC